MEHLPSYVYITFALTVLALIWQFYKAAGDSNVFLIIIVIWIVLQSILGIEGYYKVTNTMPPRFPLLVLPPFLLLLVSLITPRGKAFLDGLSLKRMTMLHTVRIPVEVVIFWLVLHKAMPRLMTFEGRNFDILSGLSAPIVWYFTFVKRRLGKPVLLIWNFLCLGLLINVAFNAVLSAPSRFQQFAFDQPNIALGYFPFLLLPACIVPIVLLSHAASIRLLLKRESEYEF